MSRPQQQLRDDALAIWQTGVAAVRSDALVRHHVRASDQRLQIGGSQPVALDEIRRIAVVGAGKAGAGMAAGLEAALGEQLMDQKQLTGWVNVPEDCLRPLSRIHLHAARPAGVNSPTAEGVRGTERILEMLGELTDADLGICLISGGGSALLPAPAPGITLADKQQVTAQLSGAGANIRQLNTVRKQLSRVKGGGLARRCGARHLFVLIISDVIGDPLDVIASGPTVADTSTPREALEVLQRFGGSSAGIPQRVLEFLERTSHHAPPRPPTCRVSNIVIGNNATAVEAAASEARRRGYRPTVHSAERLEGHAEQVGRQLVDQLFAMREGTGSDAIITGGEPTVELVAADQRGLGGRNQQLVLAALQKLMESDDRGAAELQGLVLLSGGTDGEDGPTDAAGAVVDAAIARAVRGQRLQPEDYLRRNDAYHFFDAVEALIKTGPTHTNVCDVRVGLIASP